MDFMKVIDQTVREIKREVNLKVLKVPEIEQKVLDATDNEPWGPHGTALAEIAQATKKFNECQMVMNVLWTRLGETDKDWRYVYKALSVIEYLIANGSERALDDIIEHTYQISSLTAFEYAEPNGKDMGINVRKKAENVAALLNDNERIQEARRKAAATREKYVGLSSRGITYKSGSAAFSGSNFQSGNRYGGFSERYDSDSYRYKHDDRFQEENFEKYVPKAQRGTLAERRASRSSRDWDFPSSVDLKPSQQSELNDKSYELAIVPSDSHIDDDEDDDDFDPRGTTSHKPTSSRQLDLFGESLMRDLLETPAPAPPQSSASKRSSDVDLFADADFVSAAPQVDAGVNSQTQPNIDLFATEPAVSATASSPMDFLSSSDPYILPETKSESTGSSKDNFMDPFAEVQSGKFSGSDILGAFTTQHGQSSLKAAETPLNNNTTNGLIGKSLSEYKAPVPLKEDTFQVTQSSLNNNAMIALSGKSSPDHKAPPKKDNFQVKSGIWADSLSRGLIDLNITAPKKVNLADIGIIGESSDGSDQKSKAPSTSYITGTSTGMGPISSRSSSVNSSASSGDACYSSFNSDEYQFGSFQK